MALPEYIKCKFCDWHTRKWRMSGRNRVSGFGALRRHIEDAHPDQAELIRQIAENNREWTELLAQFGAKPNEDQVDRKDDD